MKYSFPDLRSLTNKVSQVFSGYLIFFICREEREGREDNGKKVLTFPTPSRPSRSSRQTKFRLLPIAPLLVFVLFYIISCTNKKNHVAGELKIAKTVPNNYKKADDSGFVKHQDTVYYQGNYFTGYQFSLYPTGDTEVLQSFFNGVEEGIQKKWYPNRQLAEERFYINGKKEGIHKGWWPDGKQKFMFSVSGDEYNGEFKEWYSSGLLGKQFHYVDGREEGSERLWWDNGTVRANYVIRNGRKYGLIGLKTCVNPYDSISKK